LVSVVVLLCDENTYYRVQETLKYVENFNNSEVYNAQSTVAKYWSEKASDLNILINQGNEDQLASYVVKNSSQDKMKFNIWLIIDFYESLAVCVNEKVCDEKTALAFFGERSVRFYNMHFHFIESIRSKLNDENYAKLLQGF